MMRDSLGNRVSLQFTTTAMKEWNGGIMAVVRRITDIFCPLERLVGWNPTSATTVVSKWSGGDHSSRTVCTKFLSCVPCFPLELCFLLPITIWCVCSLAAELMSSAVSLRF